MNSFTEALYKEVNVGGEKTLERWEKVGFLEGIKDERLKEDLAWSFDQLAKYLMENPAADERWDTVLFPMLRRIICGVHPVDITQPDIDVLNRRVTPEELFQVFDYHTVNDLLEYVKNVGNTYHIRHNYMASFNVFYSLTLCNVEKRGLSLTDFWGWFYDNFDTLRKAIDDYVLVIDDLECCVVVTYCWYAYELLKKEPH